MDLSFAFVLFHGFFDHTGFFPEAVKTAVIGCHLNALLSGLILSVFAGMKRQDNVKVDGFVLQNCYTDIAMRAGELSRF